MIISSMNKEGQTAWILQPNRSATWNQACLFFSLLSLLSIAIAVGFALLGAWLILPFAGMEVLLLFTTLWLVHNRLLAQEVIRIDKKKQIIALEYGNRRHLTGSIQFNLNKAALIIKEPQHLGHNQILIIQDEHETAQIGAFLNKEEKRKLIEQLNPYIFIQGSIATLDYQVW